MEIPPLVTSPLRSPIIVQQAKNVTQHENVDQHDHNDVPQNEVFHMNLLKIYKELH